jgi:hypothetical protein
MATETIQNITRHDYEISQFEMEHGVLFGGQLIQMSTGKPRKRQLWGSNKK